MDIKPLKVINEGEPGYRSPTAHGTVDVFYKLQRYVFLVPTDRVLWRAAVAKLILGAHGKSADLVRLDRVPPAGIKRGQCKAKQYRIGELKKKGAQVVARRRPGDPPLYAPAGLVLVDTVAPGDPRRLVPGWGKRRGCFLVVDGVDGMAYFFRGPYKGLGRKGLRDQLVRAWMLNDGPPVEVRGRYPAYGVIARRWSAEEKAAIAGQRVKEGLRLRRFGVEAARLGAEKAAKAARLGAEKAARGRVFKLAKRVNAEAERVKRAEVSAVRWPGPEREEAKRVRWLALDKAWADYLRQVEADRGKVKGARPLARPARFHASVGELPRPAWVMVPEGDD